MKIISILSIAAVVCGLAAMPGAALSRKPAEPTRVMQASACPPRPGSVLENVEVFDGPIAERAMLRPEDSNPRTGYWPLAYVYEAGRTVNLRCLYRGGGVAELELRRPVRFCRYSTPKWPPFTVWCR